MMSASTSIESANVGVRSKQVFRALVVDDDPQVRRALRTVLESQGWIVEEAESVKRMKKIFGDSLWNIIYLDKCLPDGDGLSMVEYINAQETDAKVIMITGQGSADEAMLAVTMGVDDYLTKPVSSDVILRQLHEYEISLVRPDEGGIRNLSPYVEQHLIGRSTSMIEAAKEIQRVAPTDRRVLITGPSGTGKEVVAREIFRKSKRARMNFVSVNCGAINRELIESELFGHEKGAFTGAHVERAGLLEEAHEGTIFLDEITETPPDFQVKLLRFLQEGEIRRVGSNRVIRVDVRVISASNRNLDEEMEQGRFRSDLYYRLNQSQINLLPLKERTEDIMPLVEHFIGREARKADRIISYATSLFDVLYKYEWEGNVRELEHAIIHAVSVCDGVVRISDLPRKIKDAVLQKIETGDPMMIGKSDDFMCLEEMQDRYIEQVLTAKGGNIQEAASTLGVHRRTLERRVKSVKRRREMIDELMTNVFDELVSTHGADV